MAITLAIFTKPGIINWKPTNLKTIEPGGIGEKSVKQTPPTVPIGNSNPIPAYDIHTVPESLNNERSFERNRLIKT